MSNSDKIRAWVLKNCSDTRSVSTPAIRAGMPNMVASSVYTFIDNLKRRNEITQVDEMMNGTRVYHLEDKFFENQPTKVKQKKYIDRAKKAAKTRAANKAAYNNGSNGSINDIEQELTSITNAIDSLTIDLRKISLDLFKLQTTLKLTREWNNG